MPVQIKVFHPCHAIKIVDAIYGAAPGRLWRAADWRLDKSPPAFFILSSVKFPMRHPFPLLVWLSCRLMVLAAPAATFYVDQNSPNPTPPYGDWSTAALTIQVAVDAATKGDLILVNDGFYQDGWRTTTTSGLPARVETNRLVLAKPVTVQSLNGPSRAFISGNSMYRCAWLTNGAVLNGFTLIYGAAGWSQPSYGRLFTTVSGDGGGATGPLVGGGILNNCLLEACTATGSGGGAYGLTLQACAISDNQATNGGGAAASTLINCLVTGNQVQAVPHTPSVPGTAYGGGGGLLVCSAINCLITGNQAFEGGGAFNCPLLVNCTIVNNSASFYGGICPNLDSSRVVDGVTNCLIYFNAAGTNANYGPGPYNNLSFGYTCTLPLPAGFGNLTNAPTFVDFYGGDFHPDSVSPVINSGLNTLVTNLVDLDGNPRVVGGTVDMGAFEYQTPASLISYAWLENYGLPTDGSADFLDPDGDGLNNWQEWVAGTNPTNAASVLKLSAPVPNQLPRGWNVRWQSVAGKTYCLQRSPTLSDPAGFTTICSNLTGLPETTAWFDATGTNGARFFYRVGVQ